MSHKEIIDQYAVFGNPVSHSLSPQIHSLFAQQCGQSLSYKAIEVQLDQFSQTANDFFQQGGKGVNITVPFKQDAYAFATVLSDRAKQAGAVNTLFLDADNYFGDNTDGAGIVYDLIENHQIEINHKKILIVGAGGAVRGVLGPLLEQAPESITICNRTFSKAEYLAQLFSDSITVVAKQFADIAGMSFDIVINGTSASLNDQLPPLPEKLFVRDGISYDMMYSKAATLFQTWSREQGAGQAFDGLGMLVEQAAESFEIWRNIRPDTRPVLKTLRDKG